MEVEINGQKALIRQQETLSHMQVKLAYLLYLFHYQELDILWIENKHTNWFGQM